MHTPNRFLCAALAALTVTLPEAQSAFPTTGLKAICLQQIHSPTNIVNAADGSGRLFICDQPGVIYILQNGMLLPTPFLNLASPANAAPNNGPGPVIGVGTGYTERGLLGLTFHPGFANPLSPGYRKFYLNFNKPYVPGAPDFDPPPPVADHTPNCTTVIAEYQVSASDPNIADTTPANVRWLLRFTQPQANHNGGQLEFGPDGYLYIGVGDGGSQDDNNVGHTGGSAARPTNGLGNSQDRTRFLGKILRIDPLDPDGDGPLTYSIPASNPFFANPDPNIKKEIYAFGLRNPWKFCFDRRPGGDNRLYCGDVGGGRIEEVNIIVSGGNYGWRYREGFESPLFSSANATNPMLDPLLGPYLEPIAQYAHPGVTTTPPGAPGPLPQNGLSITGGYIYRGSDIPALVGKYVFADYGSTGTTLDGRLMGLEETSPGVFALTNAIPLLGTPNPITTHRVLCLGEDENGELYVGLKTNTGVLLLDPPVTGFPAGGIYKFVPVLNENLTILPTKDNTIFSESAAVPPTTGYPSDALGYLYAGRTGPNHGPYLRRALMAFDVAGNVPAGAIIQSAQVELRLTKIGPSGLGQTMALHRLSETWGEGTSRNALSVGYGAQATTNDATWVRRFFDTSSWTTPGGQFSATASSSAPVGGTTVIIPSSALLVSDVQGWLDNPVNNAGWILRGDEALEEAVCQISSLQEGFSPPQLRVAYLATTPLTHYETWLRTHFRVGEFVAEFADLDGDGIVALLEYAWGFSPKVLNPASQPNPGIKVATAINLDGDRTFSVDFRRDPLATDLTYRLETTSDFVTWTTLVESIGGAPSSGAGLLFEEEVVGEEPIQIVHTLEVLSPGGNKRFARLKVSRGGGESFTASATLGAP